MSIGYVLSGARPNPAVILVPANNTTPRDVEEGDIVPPLDCGWPPDGTESDPVACSVFEPDEHATP